MAGRTRIVCLHEGEKGRSIDPVFIRALLKSLDPAWIRPWDGSNVVRLVDCGGRSNLIARMPQQLRTCLEVGSDTTLMVWADLDHDMADGDDLKTHFWHVAEREGINRQQFDSVVFVFAKDRLENWIEFLNEGRTDESKEGRRLKYPKEAAEAAKKLANRCRQGTTAPSLPTSLYWSCTQWRAYLARMT
jgi:hypothetical protein